MTKRIIPIISILTIAAVFLLLSPLPVQAVPQPPHCFRGDVTIGGSASPDGATVTAAIAGASFPYSPSAQTSGGRYGDTTPLFKVPADDPDTTTKEGGINGDTVYFYVNGVAAGSYTYEIGGSTEVDLAIASLPTLPKPGNVQRTTPDTDNKPTFTWDAVTNAKSYEVRIDTGAFIDVGNVTTYTSTTIADGSHAFEVRAIDVADQAGASSDLLQFTIDTTPPGVNITAVSPDPTIDNTPTINGTATDTATAIVSVEYRVNSGNWTAANAADGNFNTTSEDYTFTTSALADGSHTVQVRATDATSFVTAASNYASDTFVVDTVAPTVTITTLSPDPTSDSSPTFTGTAVDVTTSVTAVEYRVDSGSWTAANATDGTFNAASEDYTFTTSRLADGSHTVEVRARDAANNVTAEANYASDTFSVSTGVGGVGGVVGGGTLPQPGKTNVYNVITSECEFSVEVVALSDDGVCWLTIPEGTIGLKAGGVCLYEITIYRYEGTLPAVPEGFILIGYAYDLGPDGATFDPPATFAITFDPESLPEGIGEDGLYIAYWDGSEWVVLESTVDIENYKVMAGVSHFTLFALFGKLPVIPTEPEVPPPTPARFTVADLSVTPGEVQPNGLVTISVLVTNVGGSYGAYNVVLKVNDIEEARRRVTLRAGKSERVTFTIAKEAEGSYTVDVNGVVGQFAVSVAAPPPPPPPPPITELEPEPEPTPAPTPVNWWLIGSIIATVLVIGVGTLWIVRLRK